jgi:hypothetical protein
MTTILAMANTFNGFTYNLDSKIYKWTGTSFAEFQSIPTNGAVDWEFFTVGDDAFLAVANAYNGSTYNINSTIYRWNGAGFTEFRLFPTIGASDWEYFTVGGGIYLAMANNRDSTTYGVDSLIYKARLHTRACYWNQNGSDLYCNEGHVGIGTTSPRSAVQVEGYVQLDTLTSAPPSADCDEASERGRIKVDIANDLLYICTNTGWVAK